MYHSSCIILQLSCLYSVFSSSSMATLSLNIGNFITLRFNPSNYPLWHEQALVLAESLELEGHLTNEDHAPNKYPRNSTNTDNTIP